MTKVFVYGTLLTGFHNWRLYVAPMLATGQASLLGEATTTKPFPMIVTDERNVPAMFNTELGECISGEVYEVNEDCVKALDIIEGTTTGFYHRGNIDVRTSGESETCVCNTYFKGSGEKFDMNDGRTTSCSEEKSQMQSWIDSGSSFIPKYTAELHKSYYINKFMPPVLALASKRTEEDVLALFNDSDFQDRFVNAKDKFVESELLGELWKKLL